VRVTAASGHAGFVFAVSVDFTRDAERVRVVYYEGTGAAFEIV
jgi:hypothetical protein